MPRANDRKAPSASGGTDHYLGRTRRLPHWHIFGLLKRLIAKIISRTLAVRESPDQKKAHYLATCVTTSSAMHGRYRSCICGCESVIH